MIERVAVQTADGYITQPIIHDGLYSKALMSQMIDNKLSYKAFKKPENITFITIHNYFDDETGTAESKLHRNNHLYTSEDGRKISVFEKSLEHLGIGSPVVLSKPVCGHHATDEKLIEKYGMYSHIMKEMWLLEHLNKGDNTELTMFCDAGDVIFIDDPQRTIDIFYEYDCDLLFMSTTFCEGKNGGYNGEFMQPMLDWQNSLQIGPNALYLNAGVFIGKTDFIIEVLETALEFKSDKRFTQHPLEAPEHLQYAVDQEILRALHPQFYPRMKIDNESVIATECGRKLAWRT